jgi:hypothetical protein
LLVLLQELAVLQTNSALVLLLLLAAVWGHD